MNDAIPQNKTENNKLDWANSLRATATISIILLHVAGDVVLLPQNLS